VLSPEDSPKLVVYRENVLPTTVYLQSNSLSSSLSIPIFQQRVGGLLAQVDAEAAEGGERSRELRARLCRLTSQVSAPRAALRRAAGGGAHAPESLRAPEALDGQQPARLRSGGGQTVSPWKWRLFKTDDGETDGDEIRNADNDSTDNDATGKGKKLSLS